LASALEQVQGSQSPVASHDKDASLFKDSSSILSSSGGHGGKVVATSNTKLAGRGSGAVLSCVQHSANGMDADGVVAGSSLVPYVSRSNADTKHAWNRQQKRGYHRIQSCLQYWQGNGYQVLWVTLTTAEGGDVRELAYHHHVLRGRIERQLGYVGIQHYQVRTSEGNGVLHILWAWRADNGFRQRSFYVSQAWLSAQWREIHQAPVVWVCRVKRGRGSRNRVSRYAMSQYVGQQVGYQYMSWSWGRTFGFPLVTCWRAFKGLWSQFNGNGRKEALYRFWGAFLAGASIPLGGSYSLSLEAVRSGYREWGRDFWDWSLGASTL